MGGGGGQVFNRPSFSFLRTFYPVQLRFFWDVLAAIFTRAANTCERQNVCHSSMLAGWLAGCSRTILLSFWQPLRSRIFFFFHFYYFFLSFPENVISACFCQSTGVLCSLEWGSGPLKRTDKWQARRHQCVCGPERDVCGGIYLWTV